MKLLIEIPNHSFDSDIADKFQDYFNRVKADIADGTVCGNYELETTEMFLASFKEMQVLPDNATNGDMIKAMFDCQEDKEQWGNDDIWVTFQAENNPSHNFDLDWWNAPYKRGSGE